MFNRPWSPPHSTGLPSSPPYDSDPQLSAANWKSPYYPTMNPAGELPFFFIDGIKIYELRSLDAYTFQRWARSIKTLLLMKGLLPILQQDEIFISPTTSTEWVKRDREVFAYLRNAVAFEVEKALSSDTVDYSEPSMEHAHSRAKRFWDLIEEEVYKRNRAGGVGGRPFY
ncbi:hypothetical protein L198_02573 [Cryptococcus wingfieldii CBS 7118]|uniref:Uncharacterized protein n=1 Tax=Cryptococcus wingfieldii CBS 7118 TaxID=1295528 RepID=A0A1E3JMG2_9TREE|nr:hypothetical protein L198_02573 [Cryptococcus wingfieldii CBS 7118]ODO01846.1 hypothetical protein L198_02573 [Cryptococcus wingfieldii CBS 7118]